MRNRYSNNFECCMIELAPYKTLDELLKIAHSKYHYKINKNILRQYLYKRHIKYKDYNSNRVRNMGSNIPIGTERIKDDGMIQVKVAPDRWEYKQRLIYEKYHNIKLTSNDYIIFLDQNRNNFNINNLMRVSRHESSILSNQKMFSHCPEVTKTGVQVAKLIIKTKEKEKSLNGKA